MTIPSEDLALVLPYVADHDDDEAVIMRYEHLTQTRYAHKIAIIRKELALQSRIEQFRTPITVETIEQRKAELANPVSESIIDRLRVLAQDPLDELNNVDAKSFDEITLQEDLNTTICDDGSGGTLAGVENAFTAKRLELLK